MTYIKYLTCLIGLLSFSSCHTSEEKKAITTETNTAKNEYVYSIDTSGVSMVWTAYKFTNKIGVPGTFNNYSLIKKKESGSVAEVLNDLKLTIPTASVDSKNPIRDFKLDTYFFKAFNTPTLKGTILNAQDNEGFIKLQMNKMARKIPYTYALQNDTVVLFTHLDLNLWNGEEALAGLNEECYELHKGTDGISKLWPDVDVKVKLPVFKSKKINP